MFRGADFIRTISLAVFCVVGSAIPSSNGFSNFSADAERGARASLWEDLYYTCGSRVSFYCVQNKFMNYINETLNSDLRITEGIYFVKNNNEIFKVIEGGGPGDNVTRNGRWLLPMRGADNDRTADESSQEAYEAAQHEEAEVFSNFIKTVEHIEDGLEKADESNKTKDGHGLGSDGVETKGGGVPSPKDGADSPKDGADSPKDGVDSANDGTRSRKTSDDNLVIRSLSQVSDVLYDKTTNYLTTHDLRLNLPEIFFASSQLQISPRGFDSDGGVLVKLNVVPQTTARAGGGAPAGGGGGGGNFVSKYFHKVFKKKLLTSFLALLLIIKLIKIKIMYVLPFLIGVSHAKKLLLKTLLFLFPPLVHLFKLCTYYHAHASKLHYHHHKVKHHHHHIKVPVPVPVPVPIHKPSHYNSQPSHEDEYPPYPEYPSADPYSSQHPAPEHNPHDSFSGIGYTAPEAGSDYYTRNDMGNVQQHLDEFDSWGLKEFYASTESPGVLSAQAQAFSPYSEHNYKKQPPTSGGNSYNTRISAYPSASAVSYKDPYGINTKKNKNSNGWKNKATALTQGGTKSSPTVLTTYDPFYSPILQKIDALFTQLGFHDEGCRERLVCSMYKNPLRFSPHSNLLSTELSRDPNELEKPQYTNQAVIRFYRYVEAARNGQSQKDCLKLYTACPVKTEK